MADLVLVGGGAGGISSACVRRFAAGGFAVASVDRRRPLPDDLAGDERVRAARADFADERGLAHAVSALTADLRLRHLVCAAGGVTDDEFESHFADEPMPSPAVAGDAFAGNFFTAYNLL